MLKFWIWNTRRTRYRLWEQQVPSTPVTFHSGFGKVNATCWWEILEIRFWVEGMRIEWILFQKINPGNNKLYPISEQEYVVWDVQNALVEKLKVFNFFLDFLALLHVCRCVKHAKSVFTSSVDIFQINFLSVAQLTVDKIENLFSKNRIWTIRKISWVWI